MQLISTLFTSALCLALGAAVGRSMKNETEAPESSSETVSKAPPASRAASLQAKPPPFTSAIASMEWIRAQMEKGDTTAAEQYFRKEAGLTDEQRLALATVLVGDFRRVEPRMVARILLGLPRGQAADHLLWGFLSNWSNYDADDALRFIEILPSDRLNTVGVLHNSASGFVRLPAERVLAFASRLNEQGRAYLAEGLVALSDQIGSWRNTKAILDQLNAKPQKDAISPEWFLGRQLAEIDPQALERRIAAETDPLKLDKLFEGYASHLRRFDPERGLAALAQMQHPEPSNVTNHVENWLTSNRAAALVWLQGDAARQLMPQEDRARLLRVYQKEATP
jgi:hypothetical protein